MEKNTAWAIGLSSVVLIGFFAVQSYLMPKNTPPVEDVSKNSVGVEKENNVQNDVNSQIADTFVEKSLTALNDENLLEENFTIETKKVKVIFTNRGGDVLSYQLKDHFDSERNGYIEMADNISQKNRAFSLSIGGADASISNEIFTAKKINDKTIGFFKNYKVKNSDGTIGEFTIVKTYYFDDSDYVFKLDVTVSPGENFKGLDLDNAAYSLRTSPQMGPFYNPKMNRYENRQFISYNGKSKKSVVLGTNQTKTYDKPWKWVSMAGKYFEVLIYPASNDVMSEKVTYTSKSDLSEKNNAQAIITRQAVNEEGSNDTYYIYVGPRNEKDLRIYNVPENNVWKLDSVRFDDSMQTSGFLSWLEVILKFLLEFINKFVHNWGISIIIVTAILKFAMFPITAKTAKSTVKMQEVQPKMQALQEKYKGNPQKLNEQTAKLYKEIGYNPLSGCLPMLAQFVILFAMYNLFNNYFEFRGASFIPGWISDLSTGDTVKTLGFDIPLLGNQIRLLPVIYVISQLLFGKITQNGGTSVGQSNTQMKLMMYGMPILFFFLFYNAPSGLLLYWTVSNLIQLGQQLFINSRIKK
ncbi:membrane protein insertase YidC [Treponema pectinovorum]|uniref:membrane protein insertase YidC n=1 Tax=Treponema pectinovorum TaxID=164 RepID=UPI0011CC490E|nr:membrane protein insertase YidC [Treponema pectinovorum]